MKTETNNNKKTTLINNFNKYSTRKICLCKRKTDRVNYNKSINITLILNITLC